MYAQKLNVTVVIRGEAKPCPLEWLDQFCMRNFTNAAEFDDTLPIADGQIETSFRLTPQRFAEGFGAWRPNPSPCHSLQPKREAIPKNVSVSSAKIKNHGGCPTFAVEV